MTLKEQMQYLKKMGLIKCDEAVVTTVPTTYQEMKKYTFTELREGLTDAEIASVCGINFRIWNDFIATQKEMAMTFSYEELCEALEKK